MSNLTVTVVPVSFTPPPGSPAVDHINIVTTDSAGAVQTQSVLVANLTNGNWVSAFTGLADGPGTAVASAMAADNVTVIGAPISGSYTLPIGTVQVPGALQFS